MPNSNYLIEYPLLYAIWNGKYNEVVKLIINGYNVNEPAGGYIPLIIAMTKGDLQMIELLIILGADTNLRFDNGCTPLIHSIYCRDRKILDLLIKANANVNDGVPYVGTTALIFAIIRNNLDFVKFLVENGADINKKDIKGSPLLTSVVNNCEEIVLYLLSKGAIIDQHEPYMLYAIENKSDKIIQALKSASVPLYFPEDCGL